MTGATFSRTGRGGSARGRTSAVVVVATVQLVAFGVALAVGRPTLYALFAVGSAAALAAATGGGRRGTAGAVLATVAIGGGWWLLQSPVVAPLVAPVADVLAGLPWVGPLVGAAAGTGGAWTFLLCPVALSAVVAATGDRWEGVAAASLGTVLLVVLGVPLALFVVGQDPALVLDRALSPEVQWMLALSLFAPTVATAFAVGFGVPLAYVLARGFPGRSIVESVVDLPLVMPHSVAGIVVLFGVGEGGVFPGLSVLNDFVGMVLAMAFVSAPYAVDAARDAFAGVDSSLVRAARSQGASPLSAFRRVTLPLAGRGILTGAVLAWARAVSEFGAVAVVAYTVSVLVPTASLSGVRSVRTQHAPVYIYDTYVTQGLAEAGAVATLLLALSAAVFLVVRWVAYDGRGGALG